MASLTDLSLAGVRHTLLQKLQNAASLRQESADLLNAMDAVIDGTDSRIRLINGFQKKLRDGVSTALSFVNELVCCIPGCVELSHATFASDPYVNAFFVNTDDLQSVISRSSEVSDFMERYENRDDLRCCCLLCMRKTERPVLGMALSGDILRKDVRQIAVSFSDHRIYSPAPSEALAREGLKQCLLGGLITTALGRIMQDKVEYLGLQNDRRMLYVKLRHLEYKVKTVPAGTGEQGDITAAIAETREAIRAIEDRLMRVRPATPQTSLYHVVNLFNRPERFIRLKKSSLKLDKMGIVIEPGATGPCNELELAEVEIGDEPARVVTLAQFPVTEFAPPAGMSARSLLLS